MYKITYDPLNIWHGRKPKLTKKQLNFYKNKYWIKQKLSFAQAIFSYCRQEKIYDKRFKKKSNDTQIGLIIYPFNYEKIVDKLV
tara:strand:+ start:81 stop:332 length:252 start_codon:yes stop_codon:yes gene_type:complete